MHAVTQKESEFEWTESVQWTESMFSHLTKRTDVLRDAVNRLQATLQCSGGRIFLDGEEEKECVEEEGHETEGDTSDPSG